jgi:hypothetical protein
MLEQQCSTARLHNMQRERDAQRGGVEGRGEVQSKSLKTLVGGKARGR